jgi:hypothetical protein
MHLIKALALLLQFNGIFFAFLDIVLKGFDCLNRDERASG